MQERLLTIDSAQISMYEIQEGSSTRERPYGNPDSGVPIFKNLQAESLRLVSRLDERVLRPTGCRYPLTKHVGEEHEISIERIHLHRTPEEGEVLPEGVEDRRNRLYVLQIVWMEPPPKAIEQCHWKSRTYYGVTAPDWNLQSDVDTISFKESQTLKAAFYKSTSGTGEPPAL